MHRTLLATLITSVALAACDTAPKTSDTDIQTIQYDELMQLLASPGKPTGGGLLNVFKKDTGGKAVLVDVRHPDKYAAGHIPGAVNIPLPDLDRQNRHLAEATVIIVYADGWTDYLSPAGAKKLMALGYSNVYEFRGGMELWREENGRVETGEAQQ